MNCPRCKDEYQEDNFCSNCGVALWEKCSECGEMELIGRSVCETKYEAAKNEYCEMYDAKDALWIIWFLCVAIFGFIGIVVAGKIISNHIENESFQVILYLSAWILAFSWVAIVGMYVDRTEPKSKKMRRAEFYKKFPEYTGIFEEVEKGGKK